MEKYEFHLVREMYQTAEVIRHLDVEKIGKFAEKITGPNIFATGEGSSRLFPSKKARYDSLKNGYDHAITSEGSTQALEYDLSSFTIVAVSNSGRTKEVVRLLESLRDSGHKELLAITAGTGSPIENNAHYTHVLDAGKELAVAATKTVVEQALVYDVALRLKNENALPDLNDLADQFHSALDTKISPEVVSIAADAKTIYWAGRNDGVAEELTLKTNEITRKQSDYLEGTYAVHGIEEIMDPRDIVFVMRPFDQESAKFNEVLCDGVGLEIVTVGPVASGDCSVEIADAGEFSSYLELAMGWNLLVEVGMALDVDLDHPKRARKVGNEL